MFGFGQKQTRAARFAGVRPKQTAWLSFKGAIRDRYVLVRLGLCAGALLLLLVALESWKSPFPFRLGTAYPHGLAAKADFEIVDEESTNRARDRAEAAAPRIFRHNASLLTAMPERLQAALAEVAQSPDLESLSLPTREAFGLIRPLALRVDENHPESASGAADGRSDNPQFREAIIFFGTAEIETRFKEIKAALSTADMPSAQKELKDIVDDFAKFIGPFSKYGVLHQANVARYELQPDTPLRVLDQQGQPVGPEINVDAVRLPTILTKDFEKSWISYPSVPETLRKPLSHWLIASCPNTLEFDQQATGAARSLAREQVVPLRRRFLQGDQLLRPGQLIDERTLRVLSFEYAEGEEAITFGQRLARIGVVLLMVIVLAIINGYYIVQNEALLAESLPRLAVYLGAIVVTAGLARMASFDPLRAELVPLLFTVIVLAIAYHQDLAMLTAFSMCLLLALATSARLTHFVTLISTCSAAIIGLKRVASRSTLIQVGFAAALTFAVVNLGAATVQAQSFREIVENYHLWYTTLFGAFLCLAAALLVTGALPFIESTFGVVTDLSLLELSDPSHPLLQELVRRAPGTYNHSISVASIAEAAAEAIDANGLLVRVGAYFHDIGKLLKPQYFIENVQSGTESKHENLNPAISTLIIIGHVKDGVDLAEEYDLPQPLIDFIEQHHGTTLVEYFYHEARKECEEQPDHKNDAQESSFRYPGPKPQTREAGVLMLADAVESASRTLSDLAPKRIETLVHNIVMKKLLDGQFDECPLRLPDIHVVEQSLVKSLIGIYHGRIRYPEAKRA